MLTASTPLPPRILDPWNGAQTLLTPFHSPVPVIPEQSFQRSRTIQQIVLHGLSCWALWLASDMYVARVDFFRVLSDHFVIIVNQGARNLIVESIAFDCSCLPNNSTAFPGHENRCDESFVRNLSVLIANSK